MPRDNAHKVGHKAGNIAIEEGVVAHDDVCLMWNIYLKLCENYWKQKGESNFYKPKNWGRCPLSPSCPDSSPLWPSTPSSYARHMLIFEFCLQLPPIACPVPCRGNGARNHEVEKCVGVKYFFHRCTRACLCTKMAQISCLLHNITIISCWITYDKCNDPMTSSPQFTITPPQSILVVS